MTPRNDSPAQPGNVREDDEDLVGRILRARILKTGNDHCDLLLIDPESGCEYKRHGRLYQHDSLAWKSTTLFAHLPEYAASTAQRPIELAAVYVTHLRDDGHEKLWYVHERWGHRDPWATLALEDGDVIYGTVRREIRAHSSGLIRGYLVQLDDGPVLTPDGEVQEPMVPQPDIEIFLPVEELPWDDGSLGSESSRAGMIRKTLVKGDRVQAVLINILRPPQKPHASIVRLINHCDARSAVWQTSRESSARLRFHLFFHGKVDKEDVQMPQHPLLHGLRLLLVDDDEPTLSAYADLYRLNGAQVETVFVVRDRFAHACDQVAEFASNSDFDLVMVDNNLPGKGQGERLVELVGRRLKDRDTKVPRFLLLTANPLDAYSTSAQRERLVRFGVVGLLRRPFSHANLRCLLAGESRWEEAPPQALTPSGQARQALGASRVANVSPRVLLAEIAQLSQVRFAMLLRIDPELPASECLGAGQTPFNKADLKAVLADTDLHLLSDGRTDLLSLKANEAGNVELRASAGEPARWLSFSIDGEIWIFGVGYARDWDPEPYLCWWRHALAGSVAEQSWVAWAHESSIFVELGIAHEGLCHEVFNLRNRMHGLLDEAAIRLDKPVNDTKDLSALLNKLREAHLETLGLAEHLLEGLSYRKRYVFLPAARESIIAIVSAECESKNLRLDIGEVPPIALPIPSAALVLPTVNLALNAAKHHYRQDNRYLSIIVDINRDAGRLYIDVRDNGPGLSVAARARLWQAGRSTAANVEERHGMGLWLSRRLADEAGGSLECIESWRFLGSHFRLSFPIEL